jgi:TRAP-type C4-dicarboxylate transport system permease small subunit
MKKTIGRIGRFLLNAIEIYVPFIAFIIFFIVFIISIFFRYVLNDPLQWSMEVQLMTFMWVVLLGAVYTWRQKGHIVFLLVYERLNDRWKRIFRLTSNFLVIIACASISVPSWIYLKEYMQVEKTASFGIGFDVVFFPVVPFFVLIAAHAAYDMLLDFNLDDD